MIHTCPTLFDYIHMKTSFTLVKHSPRKCLQPPGQALQIETVETLETVATVDVERRSVGETLSVSWLRVTSAEHHGFSQ